jgi:hypothetical protein
METGINRQRGNHKQIEIAPSPCWSRKDESRKVVKGAIRSKVLAMAIDEYSIRYFLIENRLSGCEKQYIQSHMNNICQYLPIIIV